MSLPGTNRSTERAPKFEKPAASRCARGPEAPTSIQLVARKPLEQVRSVAVTPESATSVVLTKVLLPEAEHVPLGEEADAKMLIGDAAAGVRILYGGSVTGANAEAILSTANVDGALVGGASLTADKFVPIVEAAARC